MNMRIRTASVAVVAIAAVWTTGCAPGIQLHTADAAASSASKYVSFFVLPGDASADPDTGRQLEAEIVTTLAAKGMVETSPEEAEAVVVTHTATPEKQSRDAFYQGWGGWAWRTDDARSQNGSETYRAGSLVVDVFDAWTKELVWHGSAHAAGLEARPSAHTIQQTVAALLKSFPLSGKRAVARSAGVPPSPAMATEAMRILFSPAPAILIRLDGEPRYENVGGTDLQRITNANALIVREESGMFYARVADRWMEAYDVTGTWAVAGTVPEGAARALQEYARLDRSDLLATGPRDPIPVVYVSMAPATLIVTDGEPQYGALDGTPLLRMTNTDAAVYKEPTDRELYVHLPDGWFRAWTTVGPWQAVSDLPADLRN